MDDMMTFPDTVEEFMDIYKIVDTDGIYMSKGAELVPLFRMKQWFEHLPSAQPERKKGKWIDDGTELGFCCADCGITWDEYLEGDLIDVRMRRIPNFCPNCGADTRG